MIYKLITNNSQTIVDLTQVIALRFFPEEPGFIQLILKTSSDITVTGIAPDAWERLVDAWMKSRKDGADDE